MGSDGTDVLDRARSYASLRHLTLGDRLGFGMDGIVLSTDQATAVKVHERDYTFGRELAAYLRLRDDGVLRVGPHRVPQIVGWDNGLLALEMTIVQPPFLLDFSSAYLDQAPDFPPEVMEQWRAEKREQFGDRWPRVERVLRELRSRYGLHLLDIHPGNITFAREER